MLLPDDDNSVFTTAANFINNTSHPVFLTGKAGTGKTTFLKYIREHTSKNTVIVAPTGVAAINAGGTTIHSFFQLPFGPFLPGKKLFGESIAADKNSLLGNLKLSGERREIMEMMELLIIDEISMVRCDVLDAIDTILRHVRKQRQHPFGGVQVLYIGDMYQLPPVVKDDEWSLLSTTYNNHYFFSSLVIAEQQPVYIELKKVYRQSDSSFIGLLNQVRNNEMDQDGYEPLHERFIPDFKPDADENYITLTTHNNKAEVINSEALATISEKVYSFTASITGAFYGKSFPADEQLKLKVGAQVMFLKNDAEKIRRYYNGKIGIIEKIEEDKLVVSCDQGAQRIEVKKETWKNIKYALNSKTQLIEEEELGSFSQFPLRLAWAITIHKSQGLTFQNAIIDAGNAFAPGQVYVALSRCTTLKGIILKSRITQNSLKGDERIVEFASKQQNSKLQEIMLFKASKQYQQEIVLQLFDYDNILLLMTDLRQWITDNNSFGRGLQKWVDTIIEQVALFRKHGIKFSEILHDFFLENTLPEENVLFQERFKKAVKWFLDELIITRSSLLASPASTDNRQLSKDYGTRIQKIFDQIGFRVHLPNGNLNGFSLKIYSSHKRSFTQEPFPVNAFSGKSEYVSRDVTHPELFIALKDKRNEIAQKKNVALYLVCKTEAIQDLVKYLPQNANELAKISGFGTVKVKQYGKEFLEIITAYCRLHGLRSDVSDLPEKKIKKEKKGDKPDTRAISFNLFNERRTISQIAFERNLSVSTIENHLTDYVKTGEIHIDKLLTKEKQLLLRKTLLEKDDTITAIVQRLPSLTYSEVRWYKAAEKITSPV